MSLYFSYLFDGEAGDSTLTVIVNGEVRTLNPQHLNFEKLYDYLFGDNHVAEVGPFPSAEEEESWILSMASNALTESVKVMTRLSERVTFDGENIFFDGDLINNNLSRHLVRMIKANDEEFESLVNFMEKVAINPSKESRRHLFTWLNDRDFTLTTDGDVIGYKGVREDGKSITSGSNTVYVDGVEYTGHVPNPIGAVVEIARSDVDTNRGVACSYGLHVGTYNYAKWFAEYNGSGKILTVAVNPRDVVSVPSDSLDQKMRVARYVVLDIDGSNEIESTTVNVTVSSSSVFEDDDDDTPVDYCD